MQVRLRVGERNSRADNSCICAISVDQHHCRIRSMFQVKRDGKHIRKYNHLTCPLPKPSSHPPSLHNPVLRSMFLSPIFVVLTHIVEILHRPLQVSW